jgi:hypothetical protein
MPKIIQLVIEKPHVYGLCDEGRVWIYLPTTKKWSELTKNIGHST